MSILVKIDGGASVEVDWHDNMNAQNALEAAWYELNNAAKGSFTYELQYFGNLGYLVSMISDTHETYSTAAEPNFFWEFYYNDEPATQGIDAQKLNDGDRIRFAFEQTTSSNDTSAWKSAKSGRGKT